MGLKSHLSKPLSAYIAAGIEKDVLRPLECQDKVFQMLLEGGRRCIYGKAHGMREIQKYEEFNKRVPVITYEDIHPLIERISRGEKNILWPGLPIYLAKTSGTTSGTKYIPITRDSISNHINSARNALLMYMHRTRNFTFADHKMIFLQGSPVLDKKGVIPAGRLSGIVAHHVPAYLQRNRMPSWKTNCIEDWETKVDAIVEETLQKRMSLISGIPSWLRMYFEKLVERAGKPVGEIFPDFSVLVYGGLNFEPYRSAFDKLIGRPVDTVELFPASEGFIAYQDQGPREGLLLNVNSGIFYEFIPAEKANEENPERVPLEGIELNRDYAIILSSNAGLWAYNLGDLVRFVSKDPYRIVVAGRVSQFISAFGEHVIASEVEGALAEVCKETGIRVDEFHVAPMVNPPEGGLPYHQWIVEFGSLPEETLHATFVETLHATFVETLHATSLQATILQGFIEQLNHSMCRRNPYYNDLIAGNVLQPLKIIPVPKGTFKAYLASAGRLGGQNKVPRLADDRLVAEALLTNHSPNS
jgi:hypothetical protein